MIVTNNFKELMYLKIYNAKSLLFTEPKLQILGIHISPDLTLCNNANITCRTLPSESYVWWTFSGRNITNDKITNGQKYNGQNKRGPNEDRTK